MSICYHGMNKKFAEVILKKGFKRVGRAMKTETAQVPKVNDREATRSECLLRLSLVPCPQTNAEAEDRT